MTRRLCATMPHHFALAAVDAAYRDRRRRIESFTRVARRAPRTDVLVIPVVVHLLSAEGADEIPDTQVASQINALNRDFRFRNDDRDAIPAPFARAAGDSLIEFALAQRDPSGQATTGILRRRTTVSFGYDGSADATLRLDRLIKGAKTGSAAWPREDYLNVWVCPLGGGLLGYAQFPGGDASTDGVVIRDTAFGSVGDLAGNYNLGRTCVHEVGHWLNLLHIWGDDGHGCKHSDNVGDTPNQGGPNEGVPEWPSVSCDNAPHGDMFMNYMDYVDDRAMCMFTRGQIERMHATLAGPRASLAVSNGLVPTIAQAGPKPPASARPPLLSTLAGPRTRDRVAIVERAFDGVDWD